MKHYFNECYYFVHWYGKPINNGSRWISQPLILLQGKLQWEKIMSCWYSNCRSSPTIELTGLIQGHLIHQEKIERPQVFNFFSTLGRTRGSIFLDAYLLEKKVANKWCTATKGNKAEVLLEVIENQVGNFFIGYYKQLEGRHLLKELPSGSKALFGIMNLKFDFWRKAIAQQLFFKTYPVWEFLKNGRFWLRIGWI